MAEEPSAATRVVTALRASGLSVATGESLTAGLLAATLADVPGCSTVLRGGVIAYQPDVKAALLHVPPEALASGVVSREVAGAMAAGAAIALGADLGIATTGVAGPEPHDGEPVGSVWVGVSLHDRVWTRHLSLAGDRQDIRRQTVVAGLALVEEVLGGRTAGGE